MPVGTPMDRAFGEHENNPVKVELHTTVMERLPVRSVAITNQVMPDGMLPGLNTYASPAALMRHLLLHAAGNLCGHAIRLIQLHDIAELASRLDKAAWQEALAPTSDGLAAWWAVPPLTMAMRCFQREWPTAAMADPFEAASAACPAWLMRQARGGRLDTLSISSFKTPVLPGAAWTKDVPETMTLAMQRVCPGREALRQSRSAAQTVHAFANSASTGHPRWKRAARYLLGPPPRVATLYSLQRALAYTPEQASSR